MDTNKAIFIVTIIIGVASIILSVIEIDQRSRLKLK